jgi:predicted  nucleic acid-binding Zn-ribbon protein
VRVGRFAGFDLFVRASFNETVELVLRGRNSYSARVTDTAQGTIRSLEATVQGFEERVTKLDTDIADTQKRAKELETKVGAPFEHEERYHRLCERQQEIEERLDLTRNQAPSGSDSEIAETQKATELNVVHSHSQDDNERKGRQVKQRRGVRV